MARHTSRVTISTDSPKNRDKGKTFVLTELPADQAERWAIRAFIGLIQSGAQIDERLLTSGMAGLASMGIQALGGMRWEILAPLLDEMWGCVQYEHKPGHPLQSIIDGNNSQIEEVETRAVLRLALFELHLGFSLPESPPISESQQSGDGNNSTTPTFLESLGNWFRRALHRS